MHMDELVCFLHAEVEKQKRGESTLNWPLVRQEEASWDFNDMNHLKERVTLGLTMNHVPHYKDTRVEFPSEQNGMSGLVLRVTEATLCWTLSMSCF